MEALNEVAKSMNDSVDRLSSVLVWHALADDGSQGDDYEAYDEAEGYDYHGHIQVHYHWGSHTTRQTRRGRYITS